MKANQSDMPDKKRLEILSEELLTEKLFEMPVRAVLLRDNKVLVLERADDETSNAGKYDLPGGGMEGRESVEEALRREVKEETSLDVEIGPVVFTTNSEKEYAKDEGMKNKVKIYVKGLCLLAYYKSGEVELSKEHKGYQWLSIEEAIKKFSEKDTFEARKKMMVMKAAEHLKMENALDSWKRCQADFENYKKDQAKGREEFAKFAKMDVLDQLLPALDNFEASLAHVPEASKENKWVEGIVYIKKQLEDLLKNNGAEEIKVAKGDKLNPEIHEAVAGKGEKIKKIMQKGYRLNGRVLRAVRVEVE